MADRVVSKSSALVRIVVRVLLIGGIAVLANLALNWLLGALDGASAPSMQIALTGVVILSLLLYAVLMAIPFVPGLEVGLSLLMMQGAEIAPFVFLATFSGLSLAFLVGRYLPYQVLHNLFADFGLKSACRLLETLKPLRREARLDLLKQALPRWLGDKLVRSRYLSVAVALNIPGNAFIGGGGGIALVAGISGLFSTRAMLVTFALAVSPVPILILVFGLDAVRWIN